MNKPVVLIPGFGGSKLVVACSRPVPTAHQRPGNAFVNLNTVFSKEWKEKFSLRYHDQTGLSVDDTIDVHDFGGVEGVRNLCDDCVKIDGLFNAVFKVEVINDYYNYKYFDTLIGRLEKVGYSPKVDLFGAPYDFRKVMVTEYLEGYFTRLKELVETAYDMNNLKSVLVAHSIGCLITYIFLVEHCSSAWKEKYIDTFISIGGPYGGASIVVKTLLSGVPGLNVLRSQYKEVMEHSTGLILALPDTHGYESKDVLLVDRGTGKRYTRHTYQGLLPDASRNIWAKYVKPYLPSFRKNTGVSTVFAVSLDAPTETSYIYESFPIKNMRQPVQTVYGKGDTVIPADSLMYHSQFINRFANYSYASIPGNEHTRLLRSKELFDLVVKS
jgi:pimeloyl-ACP methyl ester carboxylesterase